MFPYKHGKERKLTIWMLVFGLVAGFILAPARTASADPGNQPSARASCMGHEAAGISPPGTSAEAPGGMPDLIAFVGGLPGPTGAAISAFAQLHAGSHEACDEAAE